MIALRRATEADAGAITALVHDVYAKWVPLMGVKPIPMLADYGKALRENRIDLHHIDGRLQALIETHARPDHLFIVNVAVASERQGRGLGSALLSHAEAVALTLGLHTTRLFVNQVMTGNIRLYKSLGYGIDREQPFRGGVVLHMSKRLPAA